MLLKVRGIHEEARHFGKSLASLCYGWCGKRKTRGFFRIRGERKICYGTCFFFFPLFRPLVLQLLTEFFLVFYNSTGLQFAFQKFENIEVVFVFSFLKLGVFSFVQFLFLWEGPLILRLFLLFLLYLFLLLYLFFF